MPTEVFVIAAILTYIYYAAIITPLFVCCLALVYRLLPHTMHFPVVAFTNITLACHYGYIAHTHATPSSRQRHTVRWLIHTHHACCLLYVAGHHAIWLSLLPLRCHVGSCRHAICQPYFSAICYVTRNIMPLRFYRRCRHYRWYYYWLKFMPGLNATLLLPLSYNIHINTPITAGCRLLAVWLTIVCYGIALQVIRKSYSHITWRLYLLFHRCLILTLYYCCHGSAPSSLLIHTVSTNFAMPVLSRYIAIHFNKSPWYICHTALYLFHHACSHIGYINFHAIIIYHLHCLLLPPLLSSLTSRHIG